jgi:HEPN superfamily RES-like protein
VDQLPYDMGEGGYQGPHWDTHELLFDEICLVINAENHDGLIYDLLAEIEDEIWAEYNWTALELDDSLIHSWEESRRITIGQRRFFFHSIGGNRSFLHPDDRSVGAFLSEVAARIDSLGLLLGGIARKSPRSFVLSSPQPRNGGTC